MPKLACHRWFPGTETPEALKRAGWTSGFMNVAPPSDHIRNILLDIAGSDAELGTMRQVMHSGEAPRLCYAAVPKSPSRVLYVDGCGEILAHCVAFRPVEEP